MTACLLYFVLLNLLLSNSQSCTRYDDATGTCYIDRKHKWTSSEGNIICDPSYPNCVLTCFGDAYSCGTDQPSNPSLTPHITITSPTKECTINCNSNEACYGGIINVTLCSFVNININAMDQSAMTIYAPNNDGNLFIDLLNKQTSFTNNKILSNILTESIIINCELGVKCNKNVINGMELTSILQYKCNNYCDSTQIYCPIEGDCNIQCKKSCNNMIIHQPNEDMDALQLICDENKCENTVIKCYINDTLYQSRYNMPPCSGSVDVLYNDLNLYLYYNESRAHEYDINLYTTLMHDAFIETFHIIHHNIYYNKYNYIFGNLINITFCIMFNNKISNNKCDTMDMNEIINVQFNSQYIAYAVLHISSNTENIELYEQYLFDIISSEKFLKYFNQNMNIKLFSMDEFKCIAMDINNNIVFLNSPPSDQTNNIITINTNHSHSMIFLYIIIGSIVGTMVTISIGYAMHKHNMCNFELLIKLKHKHSNQCKPQIISTNDDGINDENDNKHNMDNICSLKPEQSVTKTINKSPIHWGFTNDKYGEEIKLHHRNSVFSPLKFQQRNRILSDSTQQSSLSQKEIINIPNIPNDNDMSSNEEEDDDNDNDNDNDNNNDNDNDNDSYEDDVNNRPRSRTLNMEEAIKQHPFYHNRFKRGNRHRPHFKAMRSLSSVDISELYRSPTQSYMSREGHYTSNHNNYNSSHVHASTMPVFALQPSFGFHDEDALIEISNVSNENSTTIEQMDDDLDDYHSNSKTSINQMNTIQEIEWKDECISDHEMPNDIIAIITPMLQPQHINGSADDTEPELPLSPLRTPTSQYDTQHDKIPIVNTTLLLQKSNSFEPVESSAKWDLSNSTRL